MRIRRRPSLLVLAAAVVAIVLAGRTPVTASPGMRAAAAVSWPPSASLVISELQTGGASASDEFVEIANVGPVTADLAGFELIGASSSGATVARRVAWTAATPIGPGRHLLVANAAGVWASIADATYASGLAATGGAVALRLIGGAVVDAVGWGDAVNGFVEGAAAPAPPAGSSIERLPGGDLGNATDTNDDAADWTARAVPGPQRLADPPTPLPTPTPPTPPTPTPAASPTPSPTDPPGPTSTPVATSTPAPTGTIAPSPTVSPSLSPTPTPAPTPSPSATASPTPTPTPSPPPTPTPTPAPIAIADARRLADGDAVRIEGTLTTALGALDGDRTGFVQDTTGGIALYLDAAAAAALPAGTSIRASGTLDHRYGLTVVRVRLADVEPLGDAALPAAATTSTGGAGAEREGSRIVVTGTIADIAGTLADGLGVDVDDGSGPLRVIVDPSVLGAYTPMKGDRVEVSGPLGRRDGSTGTGYRLHATLAGSFVQVAPAPTPTLSPAPSASPTPTASPSPTPSPSPAPTSAPSPTASPSPAPTVRPTPSPTATPGDRPVVSIAAARASAVGTRVRVRAVVIAPPGRLWSDRMGALQDASGGIFVRFRTDDAAPGLGAQVDVAGTLVRSGARVILRADERWSAPPSGTDPVATPAAVDPGAAIDRAGEGRLVTVAGTVARGATARPDGHLVFVVVTPAGVRFGVTGRPGSGIGAALVRAGTGVRVTGVGAAGGAPAAGRIWLRAAGDVIRSAAAAPTSASTSATSSDGPSPTPVGIGTLEEGAAATVQGVVTAGPGLLTPVGRAIRIEDASGAIDVLLPAGHAGSGPAAGTRVLVTGTVVALKAGLRIRATELRATGSGSVPVRSLASAPDAADIGRIVRLTGTVSGLRRSGATWRAEVGVGSATVLVTAAAAAAIPSRGLVVGAHVRVTGLVLAAPASGTDRRPRIAPRGPSDVVLVSAGAAMASASSGSAAGSASSGGATGGSAGPASIGDAVLPPLRSAAQLVAAAAGEAVLVSGVVRGASAGAILVDDGTGIAHVALRGAAAPVAETVAAGDGLQAAGTTERDAAGTVAVVVDDPASIVRAGAPGGAGGAATADPATAAAGSTRSAGSTGGAATGQDAGGDPLPAPASTGIGIAALLGSGDPAADPTVDPTAGASAAPSDPLPLLIAAVAGCVGAVAAALLRRRRAAAPDPAVVRRLAQLGAAPVLPARGATGPHLDAALGTGLSSRPTGAGQARST